MKDEHRVEGYCHDSNGHEDSGHRKMRQRWAHSVVMVAKFGGFDKFDCPGSSGSARSQMDRIHFDGSPIESTLQLLSLFAT